MLYASQSAWSQTTNGREFITITMHELERVKIIEVVVQHRQTIVLAAERLHLCERQVSRLVRRYEAAGPAGLVSAPRGQPSNRELPVDLRARAMALVRERYADFGPTLACEKLTEFHGVMLVKETARRWMREVGLWIPRKQRPPKLHQPRNRRACWVELVQIDGIDHRWFEERAPACTLLVFIDDVTGQLMALHFAATESAPDLHTQKHGCYGISIERACQAQVQALAGGKQLRYQLKPTIATSRVTPFRTFCCC